MGLRILVLSAGLSVAFASSVFAQNGKGVPDDIMINSLRCEAGKIGRKLQAANLPLDKKMAVTWKDSQTNNGTFGAGFKIPIFDIGLSGDLTREELNETSSDGITFNLHPDNYAVCTGFKKRIIPEGVGVYHCIGEQKYATFAYALENRAGSVGCHYKISLVKKISGSAKIPVWGPVEFGPSGSYGDTAGYDMAVAAPPK
jgi:hypothetical protein